MRRSSLVILLVILVGAGLVYWLRGRPEAVKPVGVAPAAGSNAPEAHRGQPADAAEARRARDAMRAKILEALKERGDKVRPDPPATKAERVAAAAAASAKKDAPAGSGYDADYIRTNFREDMFPLLKSCYENALHRKPALAGRLVLDFTIVGDQDVGGVVEDADINEESDIKDEEMETCVRESLMTLTFDKPVGGRGYVTVKYPVAFSPGDEDADGGGADAGTADAGPGG